ncbi:MAG: hypothetical protein ACRDWI_11670 [Jiangellaceae bacterium]
MLTTRIAAATGVAAVVLAMTAASAMACPTRGCQDLPPPDGSEAGSGDGTVYVQVWGSGTTNGSSGGFEVPLREIAIMPPCRYIPGMTGQEYYDWFRNGGAIGHADGDPYEPHPGYEQHQDDTEGVWWGGMCSSADFDGTLGEFFDYSSGWFDENDSIYVQPGDPQPVPPIPPEVLVNYAYDSMDIPDPQLAWNPRRGADAATFVNLATWVWLEDSPVTLEVNAAAGGNTATVVAELSGMTVSAPTAEPAVCGGAGVPWSATATTDCAIVFTRSSANQPDQATEVTVETTWTVDWFANGAPQGPLQPQTMTETTDIPVAEVQALVTGNP